MSNRSLKKKKKVHFALILMGTQNGLQNERRALIQTNYIRASWFIYVIGVLCSFNTTFKWFLCGVMLFWKECMCIWSVCSAEWCSYSPFGTMSKFWRVSVRTAFPFHVVYARCKCFDSNNIAVNDERVSFFLMPWSLPVVSGVFGGLLQ